MGEAIRTRERRMPTAEEAVPGVPSTRDVFGALGDLGAALVIAFAVLLGCVLLLGEIGARPLRPGVAGGLTTLGFLVVAVLAYGWLTRGRGVAAGSPVWTMLVPAAPALVLACYALVARLLPVGTRTEWFLGGDHVRHVLMVAEEQSTGSLSYATWSYPRGWHTLVAALWSTVRVEPRDDFAAAVDIASVAVWSLSVGLALTTAALAATLADRYGLGLRAAALSGAVAGLLTFLPGFLGSYQALGFETSLLGAVTLAAVLRDQLVRPAEVRALVVAAAGLVVLAHTWQLLMPLVAVAALRSGLGVWRRRGVPGLALGAGLAAGVVVVGWPALRAVVTVVGIESATAAGVDVPTPWVVLLLGVAAALLLAAGMSWQDRGVLLLMGVPAFTGLALAAWLGITPGTYYASKLLWHTASLLLAPIAVATVVAAVRVAHARRAVARLARVLGAPAAALAALFLVVQPAGAFVGVWSTVDGPLLLRLVQAPSSAQAQVVWTGTSGGTDTVSRSFLDSVRPDPGPLTSPRERLTIEDECDLLEAAEDPTVLTTMTEEAAVERYACVPSLRVIKVP